MTTMMKRILAILCSLVMLFSAMPFTAAAEEITAEPATPTDLGGAEDQIDESEQEAVNDLSDQIVSLTKEDFSVKRIDQEKEKDELIQLINAQNPAPASMKLMARSAPSVSYHGSETSYLAMDISLTNSEMQGAAGYEVPVVFDTPVQLLNEKNRRDQWRFLCEKHRRNQLSALPHQGRRKRQPYGR